jgi:cytochrome c oxidase subunit 2
MHRGARQGRGLAFCRSRPPSCSARRATGHSHAGTGRPGRQLLAGLSSTLFVVLGAVYVAVLGLLGVAVFRSRRTSRSATIADDRRAVTAIIIVGAAAPAFVGVLLVATTLRGLATLSPETTVDDLTVEVTGHQWWWEIHYPGLSA